MKCAIIFIYVSLSFKTILVIYCTHPYEKDEWVNIFYLFQLIVVLKTLWCTSYVQEVLTLYMKELPAMNFAANTGKESMFLQRCVTNG